MHTSLFTGDLVHSNRILYTPSNFAKTNLLHLQEVGSLQAKQPHISRRSNLSSYLFFVVEKGSGILTYEEQTYTLHAGDCVFLDCRHAYSHQTAENDLWTLHWGPFYGPNMAGIYEKYAERGGSCTFAPEDSSAYITLLEQLYTLAASSDYVKDMKICEKLTSLLTLLMQESWQPEKRSIPTAKRRSLQDVKDYIDLNYAKKLSLDSLSEIFFINKFYLSRIFKEQFGVTINNYLLQVRITHAKQLLRFSDLNIEKISQECGMNDANYFARAFKKIEGVTPGEYRKRW